MYLFVSMFLQQEYERERECECGRGHGRELTRGHVDVDMLTWTTDMDTNSYRTVLTKAHYSTVINDSICK
jgi:hypothetical protein